MFSLMIVADNISQRWRENGLYMPEIGELDLAPGLKAVRMCFSAINSSNVEYVAEALSEPYRRNS